MIVQNTVLPSGKLNFLDDDMSLAKDPHVPRLSHCNRHKTIVVGWRNEALGHCSCGQISMGPTTRYAKRVRFSQLAGIAPVVLRKGDVHLVFIGV